MISYLPIDNAIFLTTSAVTDSDTGSAITDAVITASVVDSISGSTLISSSLGHDGGGIYDGSLNLLNASPALSLNTHYYLKVAASNYALEWKRLLRAENRPLIGAGSVSIDLTPGTSGLPSVTGIPLGDGTGTYGATSIGTSLSLSASTLNAIQGIRTTDMPTFGGVTGTSPAVSGNSPVFSAAWNDTASPVGARHAFQDIGTYVSPSTGCAGFQAGANVNPASGTLPHRNAVQVNEVCNGAGTIASYSGVSYTEPTGSGAITAQFAFNCTDLTRGSTTNVAWYDNPGTGKYSARNKHFIGALEIGYFTNVSPYLGVTAPLGTAGLATTLFELRAPECAVNGHRLSNAIICSTGVPADAGSPTYGTQTTGYGGSLSFGGLTEAAGGADFATIGEYCRLKGYKTNATQANTAGGLKIYINDNAGDSFGQHSPAQIEALDIGSDLKFVMNTGSSLKLGGAAVTTEGYFWYDYSAHKLKVRVAAATETVTSA